MIGANFSCRDQECVFVSTFDMIVLLFYSFSGLSQNGEYLQNIFRRSSQYSMVGLFNVIENLNFT